MKNTIKFEILAKLHRLSVNKNEHNYLDSKTQLAHIFWDAQQSKIDRLEQEVCDLSFAARAFKHVLDNPVVKQDAVAYEEQH